MSTNDEIPEEELENFLNDNPDLVNQILTGLDPENNSYEGQLNRLLLGHKLFADREGDDSTLYFLSIIQGRAETDVMEDVLSLMNDKDKELVGIDAHYDEYKTRLVNESDETKLEFAIMRLMSYSQIYDDLLEFDSNGFSAKEMRDYGKLLYQAKTALYSIIKYSIMHLKDGVVLVKSIVPEYDESLISDNQIKSLEKLEEQTRKKSIDIFSQGFRTHFNAFLKQTLKHSSIKKDTPLYQQLLKSFETIFPANSPALKEDFDYNNEFGQNESDKVEIMKSVMAGYAQMTIAPFIEDENPQKEYYQKMYDTKEISDFFDKIIIEYLKFGIELPEYVQSYLNNRPKLKY